MNDTGKIVLAGLVGAAAGAVAGLLFAPNEGKETREQIAKSYDDLKSNVEDLAEQGKEAVKDFAKNGAEKVKA